MIAPIYFTVQWKNELGSNMTVRQTGQELAGQYTSVVSGGGTTPAGDLSDRARDRYHLLDIGYPRPIRDDPDD